MDPEVKSPLLSKQLVQKQLEELEKIVKEAERRIDTTVASDPNVTKAIDCVERFLRKKRRVCYGGAAINALLPEKRRFYDPKTTVPDYDFFSPSMEEDVEELIDDLTKDGFDDITKKLSMHEGTTKAVDGILYCDPDFLRMLMYLELSRPRGEVKRWKKVFERLTLLNHEYPIDHCSTKITTSPIDIDDRRTILEFCVKKKSVMLGPEFVDLLERDKGRTHLETLAKTASPLIFLSADPEKEANDIKYILGSAKIEYVKSPSDHLYNYARVSRKGKPIALLFEEDSCHSYTLLKIDGDAEMRVGTPDTLLNLYYGLLIFGDKRLAKSYFQTSLDCLVRKLYHITERHRAHPTRFVPSFGLRCSGHQRGIAELLKLKAARTEKKKSKAKNTKENQRKTRRLSKLR